MTDFSVSDELLQLFSDNTVTVIKPDGQEFNGLSIDKFAVYKPEKGIYLWLLENFEMGMGCIVQMTEEDMRDTVSNIASMLEKDA